MLIFYNTIFKAQNAIEKDQSGIQKSNYAIYKSKVGSTHLKRRKRREVGREREGEG